VKAKPVKSTAPIANEADTLLRELVGYEVAEMSCAEGSIIRKG